MAIDFNCNEYTDAEISCLALYNNSSLSLVEYLECQSFQVQCQQLEYQAQHDLYYTQVLNFGLVAFFCLYIVMYKIIWCYCFRGFLHWRL